MPELFSDDWANKYKEIWNSDEGIADELKLRNFDSVVAFGVEDEDKPRIVLTISNGQLISAKPPTSESINWDLRASLDNWHALVAKKPPGIMKLGLAYTCLLHS